MSLLLRRIAVIVISLAIGFGITLVEVTNNLKIGPTQIGLNTTLSDYGLDYTILTTLAFAIAFGIWLDKFMNTKMLPN